MTDETPITLSQESETPVTAQQRQAFGYRYAYSRSADSRVHQDQGEDYLAIHENGQRLVFALCDGVSQSFYGNLAARLLGEALVYWLWKGSPANEETFQKDLEAFLDSLVEPASKQVETYPIPQNLALMTHQVLEQKRAVGSESTFVASLLDFAAGQLFLAWMGDSRLRLWGEDGEITSRLGESFHTAERWSTRRGRIGDLHIFSMPLSELRYLIAYSDGLARLDKIMARHFRDASIDSIIEDALLRPESDDTSFCEVWSGGQRPVERPPLSAPPDIKVEVEEGRARVRWHPVARAAFYEVRFADEQTFNVYAPGRSFDIPKEALRLDAHSVRVRAWDQEPGDWSAELPIPQELLQPAAPPPQVIPVSPPRPQPVVPTPVPSPAPTAPPPVHPRPTPLPPPSPVPARTSRLLPFISGGLVILLVGCLVGMLLFWPPFHAIFFSSPTFIPSPTIHRRPPYPLPTQTSSVTPFPLPTETLTPTLIFPSTTAYISPIVTIAPTDTLQPVGTLPTGVLLCPNSKIYDHIEVLENPTPFSKLQTLRITDCLYFDAWLDDPNYYGYFRIAPEQEEYLDLAGKWIMGSRLELPEDMLWKQSLPQVTLTPIPSPTLTPSQTPSPTRTPPATP